MPLTLECGLAISSVLFVESWSSALYSIFIALARILIKAHLCSVLTQKIYLSPVGVAGTVQYNNITVCVTVAELL